MRSRSTRALVLSVVVGGVLVGTSAVQAHRLEGVGGGAWVTSYYASEAEQVLVVNGKLRVRNRNAEDIVTRCRVEVTTSEGRTARTKKQMAVDGGGGVLVKRWRVRVGYASDSATVRKISVPHCHAA